MPVVSAAIISKGGDAQEALAADDIDLVVAVLRSDETLTQSIGIGLDEPAASRVHEWARREAIPATIRRATAAALIPNVPTSQIAVSLLSPHDHFAFGRALGVRLDAEERRVAVVCVIELPSEDTQVGRRFTVHYREAIESWDVKWLTSVDSDLRRRAGERAVAQTAVLMGALSRYRIQPRVFAADAAGFLAAIDVLGARRQGRGRSQGVMNG